ncbi:hypothetical protein MAR_002900 [Mya arenaria]|uniref:Uncharacterized protein n=1 Tax=Mya arenaria TaxID=6604 RepID=A0ABY7G4G6_MYAAR|nr:hypothetical protein MAR_005892 [Mya arenaria]WAR29332.1 hypothetical protein MAR_002900 [Mya arenaria]
MIQNTLYSKLCDRFERFKNVRVQCIDVCTEPGVYLETTYDGCYRKIVDFRERFSQWFSDVEATEEDDERISASRRTSVAFSVSTLSWLRNLILNVKNSSLDNSYFSNSVNSKKPRSRSPKSNTREYRYQNR